MCIFTPRLCNKNKKNKYEQINRKHNTHQQYKHTSNIKQYTYTSKKGKRSTRNHHNNSMRVYGCVFCSAPLLFVYLRMRISSNASSITGVLFDAVGVCGPPSYCAPLVCVPAVIRVLDVWWHNQKTVFHVFEVSACTITQFHCSWC